MKGGITPLVKTAHLAEAFHMNFEIHHGGNSLNNVANLHVIMAIRNCEFFEVLLPAGAQKYGLVEDIEVGRARASCTRRRARARRRDRLRPDRAAEDHRADVAPGPRPGPPPAREEFCMRWLALLVLVLLERRAPPAPPRS